LYEQEAEGKLQDWLHTLHLVNNKNFTQENFQVSLPKGLLMIIINSDIKTKSWRQTEQKKGDSEKKWIYLE
jgi:hypothetical protein